MPDLSWELFERQVSQCQMCGLCQNIHHKVPGQGDRHSPLMLIGEGPGQVKCRPPQNRVPTEEEAAACKLHLRIQTALIRPKVIVLLGSTAAKNIIGADIRITRDRGKWFERKGIWMMATYHPSALLRDPSKKRDAWEDMQSLRDRLMDLELYNDIYQEQTP